jgi:hypothetical protein
MSATDCAFRSARTCIVGQGSPQAQLRDARLGLTRNQLFTKQRRKKMAKIINLPTLRKWTEHDQEELLIQLFEMLEKLDNVVDVVSHQQQTDDLRQRLHDELMAMESMLANAGEVVRSAYTRKK